ncbi:Basic 7S globulin [Platanthera guangdongensis]|uniref:Basic 7S globulin n=1 Tax=Platanthera guangdongensis TaxID=2320717 RepID=A0ABR2MPN0_9ASPA
MAFNIVVILLLSIVLFSGTSAAARPRALVAPLTKDPSTLQYFTRIHQRTPPVPLDLVVDLGGRYLWLDCDTNYKSNTYRPALCRSSACSLAGDVGCGDCFSASRPGCHNNTCGVSPDNPFIRTSTFDELAVDSLSLPSTDGHTSFSPVSDPSFVFVCAPVFLTRGLVRGAAGIAGLGRTRVAPPSQLSSRFGFRRSFALCLPSTPGASGALFFGPGPGPYRLLPGLDASRLLRYTPLLTNPVSTAATYVRGEPSYEYFIGVTAIKVGETAVPINKTLLTINKKTGEGGTKISTTVPYTTLETTIYKAVTAAFAGAMANVPKTAAVAPFELCYNAKALRSTRVGPGVPAVDLVLQSEKVYWRIFGANSMIEAKDGVLCFGFVDGGRKTTTSSAGTATSIVIGGYQLEDNLVEFDLGKSRVGFSSTLLFRRTTCSNFNFTSSA